MNKKSPSRRVMVMAGFVLALVALTAAGVWFFKFRNADRADSQETEEVGEVTLEQVNKIQEFDEAIVKVYDKLIVAYENFTQAVYFAVGYKEVSVDWDQAEVFLDIGEENLREAKEMLTALSPAPDEYKEVYLLFNEAIDKFVEADEWLQTGWNRAEPRLVFKALDGSSKGFKRVNRAYDRYEWAIESKTMPIIFEYILNNAKMDKYSALRKTINDCLKEATVSARTWSYGVRPYRLYSNVGNLRAAIFPYVSVGFFDESRDKAYEFSYSQGKAKEPKVEERPKYLADKELAPFPPVMETHEAVNRAVEAFNLEFADETLSGFSASRYGRDDYWTINFHIKGKKTDEDVRYRVFSDRAVRQEDD